MSTRDGKLTDKVTLAQLRKEAERVGISASDTGEYGANDRSLWVVYSENVEVSAPTRMAARRRMLQLLRALPDGAMR